MGVAIELALGASLAARRELPALQKEGRIANPVSVDIHSAQADDLLFSLFRESHAPQLLSHAHDPPPRSFVVPGLAFPAGGPPSGVSPGCLRELQPPAAGWRLLAVEGGLPPPVHGASGGAAAGPVARGPEQLRALLAANGAAGAADRYGSALAARLREVGASLLLCSGPVAAAVRAQCEAAGVGVVADAGLRRVFAASSLAGCPAGPCFDPLLAPASSTGSQPLEAQWVEAGWPDLDGLPAARRVELARTPPVFLCLAPRSASPLLAARPPASTSSASAPCWGARPATVVLAARGEQPAEVSRRALRRCLRRLRAALRSGQVLPGGGAAELGCAADLCARAHALRVAMASAEPQAAAAGHSQAEEHFPSVLDAAADALRGAVLAALANAGHEAGAGGLERLARAEARLRRVQQEASGGGGLRAVLDAAEVAQALWGEEGEQHQEKAQEAFCCCWDDVEARVAGVAAASSVLRLVLGAARVHINQMGA